MCLGALVVLTFFLSSKYVPVDAVVNQRRSYKIIYSWRTKFAVQRPSSACLSAEVCKEEAEVVLTDGHQTELH
jgi:hypothetical protein